MNNKLYDLPIFYLLCQNSTVQKGHKTKPEQVNGDYYISNYLLF